MIKHNKDGLSYIVAVNLFGDHTAISEGMPLTHACAVAYEFCQENNGHRVQIWFVGIHARTGETVEHLQAEGIPNRVV